MKVCRSGKSGEMDEEPEDLYMHLHAVWKGKCIEWGGKALKDYPKKADDYIQNMMKEKYHIDVVDGKCKKAGYTDKVWKKKYNHGKDEVTVTVWEK